MSTTDRLYEVPYLASIRWYEDFFVAYFTGGDLPRLGRHPNRTFIDSNAGNRLLTVPVVGGASALKSLPFADLKVSEHGDWRHVHRHAIASEYGKTPFYMHYAQQLDEILATPWKYLKDLNAAMHALVVDALNLAEVVDVIKGERGDLSRFADICREHHDMAPAEDISVIALIMEQGPEAIFTLLARYFINTNS